MSRSKQNLLEFGDSFRNPKLEADFPFSIAPVWSAPERVFPGLIYHHCFEIGLCLSGSGTLVMLDKEYRYKAGDFCLIRQYDSHFHICDKNTLAQWSFCFFDQLKIFDGRIYNPWFMDTSSLAEPNISAIISGSENENLRVLYSILREKANGEKKWQQQSIVYLLSLIMVEIFNMKKTNLPLKLNGNSNKFQALAPALLFIGNNYYMNIRIAELASLCDMSERSFVRHFSDTIGRSPIEYINDFRITMAKSQILAGEKNILEIALAHGFNSLSNFNKAFQNYVGVSPGVFRKTGSVTNNYET